jgi:hypothetical protein
MMWSCTTLTSFPWRVQKFVDDINNGYGHRNQVVPSDHHALQGLPG